jgi:hypothetical protein
MRLLPTPPHLLRICLSPQPREVNHREARQQDVQSLATWPFAAVQPVQPRTRIIDGLKLQEHPARG